MTGPIPSPSGQPGPTTSGAPHDPTGLADPTVPDRGADQTVPGEVVGPAEPIDRADTSAPATPTCPSCGASSVPGDRFCETCGAPLDPSGTAPGGSVSADGASDQSALEPSVEPSVPSPSCRNCGAPPETIGEDLYCQQCGFKQPSPRDHMEIVLTRTAGVTDKGVHHYRNEDAMAFVEVGASTVVVVCDGVSTSIDPDVASQMAVDLAVRILADAVRERPGQLLPATVEAAMAALSAVAAMPFEVRADLGAPSCTYVSAVVHRGVATVGWIGDSRAYWLGPGPPRLAQLTVDDSWAVEQVAAGLMTVEQAEADPRCHAITRWLGADAPGDPPQVTEIRLEGPGRLLVCSDGLWNYASPADRIAALVERAPEGSPLAVARHLTQFAIDAGGHDNIAVVIVPVEPSSTSPEPTDPDTAELAVVPEPPTTPGDSLPPTQASVIPEEQHP